MSGRGLYDPDQVAVNTRWIQPWSEAARTQRDVELRIPINFHTVPAVSMTRACFANNQYEHNAFLKCFSNLLAVGFRQFTVDTYWDALRSVWSLCPVELPQSNTGDVGISEKTGGVMIASTDTVSAFVPQSTAVSLGGNPFVGRQDSLGASSILADSSFAVALSMVSSTSSSSSPSTSAAATPTIINYPVTDGPPVLQVGSYNCTSLMTLDRLTGVLEDYLKTTATTTGAAILLLTFDVHAASSILDPDAPAPNLARNQLPESGQLLSDVLKGNLSDETFTPTRLRDQRANLNHSWYDLDWTNRPLDGYYENTKDPNGNLFTQNGWPTEAYMVFQKLQRLVVSYGTVDPQMSMYNIGPDLDYLFPPGTINENVATTVGIDGRVISGCLFASTEVTITSATNSSWAYSPAPSLDIDANPDFASPISAITNFTACGITPFLNQTLANTTADKNPLPYAAYVQSAMWSLAPGQPLNSSGGGDDTNDNRCIVMMKSPYPGRWRVTDCSESHRVACHDPSQPYNWRISSDATYYRNAEAYCSNPYQFSVPHTALENSHLFRAFQNAAPEDNEVYINLNSLSVSSCWVTGLNGTCPYLATADTNRTRIVVVPTVAAVIIFLLAALTFFVKCAANRRENKRGRKRRMVGGWEYEGVPS